MLAVVKEKPGRGWELREIATPAPEDDEVLVKVRIAGICGSDMAIYDGREQDLVFPVVPGHEFAGEVVDRGRYAFDISLRSRVAVNLVNSCGRCVPCRRGAANLCVQPTLIGFHRNGGFAEYAAVPAVNCHVLPDSMSWEDGASVDPATSALAALKKIGITSSERICVIGPGPIGLYACQIAKAEGAAEVLIIGTRESRLSLASRLGASRTYLIDPADAAACVERVIEDSGGKGVDLVLEASGDVRAVQVALEIAGPGARIALVSIYHGPSTIDPMHVVSNELAVYGSYDYQWADFEEAIQLLASRRIHAAPLITHKFPLKEIHKAVGLLEEKKAVKVLLKPE